MKMARNKSVLVSSMRLADPPDQALDDDAVMTSRQLAKLFGLQLLRGEAFDCLGLPWYFLDERSGLRGAKVSDVRAAVERYNVQVRKRIEKHERKMVEKRYVPAGAGNRKVDTSAVQPAGLDIEQMVRRLDSMCHTLDRMNTVLTAIANIWDVPPRPGDGIRIDAPPPPLSAL
jgi:hypothetical protein